MMKNSLILTLSLTCLLLINLAAAEDQEHSLSVLKKPACAELRTAWQDDFIEDFGLDVGTDGSMKREFKCDSKERRLAETLWYLKNTQYKSNAVYLNEDRRAENVYYDFSRRHINRIIFVQETHSDSCLRSSYRRQRIEIQPRCADYSKANGYYHQSTIYHEARHLSGYRTGHVLCSRGKYAGRRICDEEFDPGDDGGTYSYEIRLLSDLIYASNLSSKMTAAHRRSLRRIEKDLLNIPMTEEQKEEQKEGWQ